MVILAKAAWAPLFSSETIQIQFSKHIFQQTDPFMPYIWNQNVLFPVSKMENGLLKHLQAMGKPDPYFGLP